MKVVLSLIGLFLFSYGYAQVCTIDYSQNTPGIYPNVLPDAIRGESYVEEITILFPEEENGVEVISYKITSVELPLGLTWECSHEINGCQYAMSQDSYACIKISGTPAEEGQFNVIIHAISVLEGNVESSYSENATVLIQTPTASTTYFSFSPSYDCEEAAVDFVIDNPISFTPVPGQTTGISYNWDFGNGQSSTVENPPTQNYVGAGEYTISLTQLIDTTGFVLKEVIINTVGCTDIVGMGNPDIYIEILNSFGTVVYSTTNSPNDGNLPQSYPMNLLLKDPPYSIRVMDDDSDNWLGVGDPDDNCINGDENDNVTALELPDLNSFGATTLIGNNQALNFLYIIEKDTTHLTTTGTVKVYANPLPPILVVDYDEPISLQTPDLGHVYHWNLNNNRMYDKKGTSIYPEENGAYTVTAVDENGCYATSDEKDIELSTSSTVPNELSTFLIYPNPSDGMTHITFPEFMTDIDLVITDVSGRIAHSQHVENETQVILDLSHLSKGVYTISSIHSLNGVNSKKLILN